MNVLPKTEFAFGVFTIQHRHVQYCIYTVYCNTTEYVHLDMHIPIVSISIALRVNAVVCENCA